MNRNHLLQARSGRGFGLYKRNTFEPSHFPPLGGGAAPQCNPPPPGLRTLEPKHINQLNTSESRKTPVFLPPRPHKHSSSSLSSPSPLDGPPPTFLLLLIMLIDPTHRHTPSPLCSLRAQSPEALLSKSAVPVAWCHWRDLKEATIRRP